MGNQIGSISIQAPASVPDGCTHSGVVRIVTGSGRRAGQVYYETLVAGGGSTAPDIAEMEAIYGITDTFSILISTEPSDKSVANATANTFSVAASVRPTANAPSLSYQWMIGTGGGAFANLSANSVYSNVTTATMTIANTAGLDGKQYKVMLTANGAASVASAVATLTVA